MSNEWGCPRNGSTLLLTGVPDAPHEFRNCGQAGYVCPACREDRADARTDRLVRGLALAGLLASGQESLGPHHLAEKVLEHAVAVKRWSAVLREREGGES